MLIIWAVIRSAAAITNGILLESGDFLLLESGDHLLQES